MFEFHSSTQYQTTRYLNVQLLKIMNLDLLNPKFLEAICPPLPLPHNHSHSHSHLDMSCCSPAPVPELNYIFANDIYPDLLTPLSPFLPENPMTTAAAANTPSSTDDGEDSADCLSVVPSPVIDPARLSVPTPVRGKRPLAASSASVSVKTDVENDYEHRIAAGMALVRAGTLSIRAAAKRVRVSHETLRRRYQGASSRQEFHTQLMALTPQEEQMIENMLLRFAAYSNMLTSSFLCNLVNDFRRNKAAAATSGNTGDKRQKAVKDLGISWTAGFRRRHRVSSEIMARSMNKEKPVDGGRGTSPAKSATEQWFEDVAAGFSKNEISNPKNVVNLVEVGYFADATTASSLNCFKRADAKLNDAAILFSTFEAIKGDGQSFPSMPTLNPSAHDTFSSEDGWATSSAFLHWLETVYEPRTSTTECRALFLDPCPTLFSAKVLQFALDHNIVFFLFPPHHQHQSAAAGYGLQPYDTAILPTFKSKLQVASPQNHILLPDRSGISNWDACFGVLETARRHAASPATILSAWHQTGLSPHIHQHTSSSTSSSSSSNCTPYLDPSISLFPNSSLLQHSPSAETRTPPSLFPSTCSSLTQYLATRPAMYFATGQRADLDDAVYLRAAVAEAWGRMAIDEDEKGWSEHGMSV